MEPKVTIISGPKTLGQGTELCEGIFELVFDGEVGSEMTRVVSVVIKQRFDVVDGGTGFSGDIDWPDLGWQPMNGVQYNGPKAWGWVSLTPT